MKTFLQYTALTLFFASAATAVSAAQQDPWAEWKRARAEMPFKGLSVSISTTQTIFYPGERITVLIEYSNSESRPAFCETRNYDRSGRLDDMQWLAVSGSGDAAPDPIDGITFGSMGGLGGPPQQIQNGESYKESFDLNEWRWLGNPGKYKVALISHRVSLEAYGQNVALPSNIIEITISDTAAGEIEERAQQIGTGIDELCTSGAADRAAPEMRLKARELRYLHAEAAMPYYLRNRACRLYGWEMRSGLFGIPNTTASLEALAAALQSNSESLKPEDAWLFQRLFIRAKFGAGGKMMPADPESIAQLRTIAEAKTGPARIASFAAIGVRNNSTSELLTTLAATNK